MNKWKKDLQIIEELYENIQISKSKFYELNNVRKYNYTELLINFYSCKEKSQNTENVENVENVENMNKSNIYSSIIEVLEHKIEVINLMESVNKLNFINL